MLGAPLEFILSQKAMHQAFSPGDCTTACSMSFGTG